MYTTTVVVNPMPSSTGATNNGPICNGGTATLNANSSNATAWSWVGSDGTSSATQNPIVTPSVTTTYSLTVSSAGSGCSPATVYTTTVVVNPVPSSTGATNSGAICNGGTATLSSNSSNVTAWSWTGPGGFSSAAQNPTVTPGVTTTYSLTVSSAGSGCSPATVYTTTVVVNPTPSSTGATNNGPICNGGTATLSANSSNATAWSWVGSDGTSSAAQNPTVTPVVTTTYSLTVSSAGSGCSPATVYTTTVVVNPMPSSTGATNNGPICNGGTATLSANSSNATAWSWVGSDGTSSATQNPIVTPSVTTTYSLTVSSAGSGCSPATVYTTTVVVNPMPSSTGATNNGPICNGGTATLSANSSNATAWSWVGSDGTSSATQNPIVTPVVTTTYSLTVSSAGSGCSPATVYTTTVVVNPVPSSTGAANNGPICNSGTATLSANSSNATAWSWVGSDGTSSATQNPIVTPVVTTTYSLTVSSAGSGCSPATVYITTVTVHPLPTISGGPGVAICNGSSTLLNATGGISYSWSPVTGLSAATGTSVAANPVTTTTYTITGTDVNGCSNTATVTVTVNPIPTINGGSNVAICNGSSTPLTASGGSTYSWSPATGLSATTGASVIANPTTTTTYTVTGTASGCSANATVTVTVNSIPSAGTISGASSVNAGSTITLSDGASGGMWSSTNTLVAVVGSSGMVAGIVAGTTTISYTVSSSCGSAAATKVVTVNNISIPAINGNAGICVGTATALTDLASGGTWSSSNASIATVGSATGIVTGVAAGTANISYITGGAYTTITITVNSLPGAITGNAPVCQGLTIMLSDPTIGGTWNSANNVIATVGSGSGVVNGISGGTVRITYTSATTGCIATTIVTINPIAPITGITNLPVGSSTTLSDFYTGGAWHSSNTSIATVSSTSGLTTGISIGSAFITYTLATGCTNILTININPATIFSGAWRSCQRDTETLTNSTPGGVWKTSNALIVDIDSATGLITASSIYTGTATITYTVAGWYTTRVMTVNLTPLPVQGPMPGVQCVGTAVSMSDGTAGGTWSASNANESITGTGTVVSVTAITAGSSTITYMLGDGCFFAYPIVIDPSPSPILGTFTVCSGTVTTLSDATTGALSYTSSNTLVATIDNAGTLTALAAGNTTITYKIMPGYCITTQVVTVNASPSVAPISGPSSISLALPITLSDAAAGGVWSSSNTSVVALSGSTGSPVTATAVATFGSSVISYAVTNGAGCTTTVAKTINATPAPPPHSTGVASPGLSKGEEVLLYPNPAIGAINIRADVAGVFYLYSLNDKALGEYKIAEGVTNINLHNDLAPGIYMGRYIGADGSVAMFKIVKE